MRVTVHPVAQIAIGFGLTIISGIAVWTTSTLIELETRTTALEVLSSMEDRSSYITVREFEQVVRQQESALLRMESKIDDLQRVLRDQVSKP